MTGKYALMQIAFHGVSLRDSIIGLERFDTIAEAKAWVAKTNEYYSFDITPDYILIPV